MATVAVFLALSGSAYAALNLPPNSVGTKQVRDGAITAPKLAKNAVNAAKVVPNSLTGAQIDSSTLGTVPHATTADSATTAEHATTADSAPLPTTLASGRTLVGDWDVAGTATGANSGSTSAQSFALPLASAPTANFVTAPTTACPGSAANPTALPGNLCVYQASSQNVDHVTIYKNSVGTPGSDPYGFSAFAYSSGAGTFFAYGSWAVTAP